MVGAACLVTWHSGAQSLVIVARLLLLWRWTAGLGSSAAGTLGGQAKETVKFAGTRLFVEFARVKRRSSNLSEVEHEIPELLSLTNLEFR